MVRVLELFAGIGACSKALSNLGIEHEIVDAVEIDKFAIKSFNAIHGTDFEPQDITKWNKPWYCTDCHRLIADSEIDTYQPDDYVDFVHKACGHLATDACGNVDLLMHGSPCQSFSIAGLGHGGDEGSGTRSSLMWETVRIVAKLRPKYVIWENVPAVLSKKHKHNFDRYLERMNRLGYANTYQVLNAKDFGIPQNRKRVFVVSRLDGKLFSFPIGGGGCCSLQDILDEEVEERYYLSDKYSNWLKKHDEECKLKGNGFEHREKTPNDVACTLRANASLAPTDNIIRVASLRGRNPNNPSLREAGAYYEQRLELSNENFTHTLTSVQKDNLLIEPSYRLRRLTPLESFRLMGFDDEDYTKASRVNSNTQLYKQAGNSICVPVLENIIKNFIVQ